MLSGKKRWLIRAVSVVIIVTLLAGTMVYRETDLRLQPGNTGSQAADYAVKQLLLASDYATASRLQRMGMYTNSILRGRKNADDCLLASQIQLALGDYESARLLVESAISKTDDEAEKARLCMQCGYICVLLERNEEAFSYIEKGLTVFQDADAYLMLAMLKAEQGSGYEPCIEQYLAYIGDEPVDPAAGTIALLTEDYSLITDIYSRLYSENATVENLMYRGYGRYSMGDLDKAYQDLNAYVTVDGPDSMPYAVCGLILYRANDYANAGKLFEQAAEKAGANRRGCLYYAMICAEQINDTRRAAELAVKCAASEDKPDDGDVLNVNLPVDEDHLNRFAGIESAKAGNYQQAAVCFREYLENHPEDSDVHRSYITILMGLSQWNAALEEIALLNEETVTVRYMKGICLYEMEDLSGAEAEFQYVIDTGAEASVTERCEGYLSQIKTRMLEETK